MHCSKVEEIRQGQRSLPGNQKSVHSCGTFNPHIDFATERPEVDWFGQKRLSAVLQSLALCLRIAISGDHDDRNVRPQRFGLGQEFKAAHPRHIDVGQDQDERTVVCSRDACINAV